MFFQVALCNSSGIPFLKIVWRNIFDFMKRRVKTTQPCTGVAIGWSPLCICFIAVQADWLRKVLLNSICFGRRGTFTHETYIYIATNSPCISAKRPWKSLRALQHDASRQTFNLCASLWTSFSHFSWSQLPHWQFKNFVAQQQPMPKLLVARRVDGNGTVRQRKKKYTTAACSEVFLLLQTKVLTESSCHFFLASQEPREQRHQKEPTTNTIRQFCIVEIVANQK